jgi:zinc transport system substrate-binding protein
MDRHVWLSPPNLIVMAKNTCAALVKIDPEHRDAYDLNLKAFEIEMNSLHARLTASMAPLKGKRFYTFHPSFGYFADVYGLEQEAIESEGKSPSARDIEAITKKARKYGAFMIIVQPQFDTKTADTIADALHGRTVAIDALAPNVYSTLTTLGAHIASLYPQKTGL